MTPHASKRFSPEEQAGVRHRRVSCWDTAGMIRPRRRGRPVGSGSARLAGGYTLMAMLMIVGALAALFRERAESEIGKSEIGKWKTSAWQDAGACHRADGGIFHEARGGL